MTATRFPVKLYAVLRKGKKGIKLKYDFIIKDKTSTIKSLAQQAEYYSLVHCLVFAL